MPRRCSIPGCETRYKQGFMLMCCPKDPARRAAWIQSVRNVGLEPKNMHFVCERHFGPTQWERVRVDGTRKLKWQSVPDTFDVDKTAVLSNLPSPESSLSVSCTEYTNSKSCPNILKKVIKLGTCDGQNSVTSTLIRGMENSAICRIKNPAGSVNTRFELSSLKSSNPGKSPSPIKNNGLPVLSSPADIVIPLKNDDDYVLVKVPPSQYQGSPMQSSLMEDLDDVRSFLNRTECSYEERLVKSIAELVKKHQLLDKKLMMADEVLKENSILKSKLKSFEDVLLDNFRMKEKLRMYKIKEVQSSALQEKIPVLEEVVKTTVVAEDKLDVDRTLKGAQSDNSSGARNDSDITPVRWVSPVVAFSNHNHASNRNKNLFVSLDDQL